MRDKMRNFLDGDIAVDMGALAAAALLGASLFICSQAQAYPTEDELALACFAGRPNTVNDDTDKIMLDIHWNWCQDWAKEYLEIRHKARDTLVVPKTGEKNE